jgi:hypothetical protein
MRPTRTKTLSLERKAHAQVIASFLDFEKSLVESPAGVIANDFDIWWPCPLEGWSRDPRAQAL